MISSELLHGIQDDASHELHHIFYRWFSRILVDKLKLTSQKAKNYEDSLALNSLQQDEPHGSWVSPSKKIKKFQKSAQVLKAIAEKGSSPSMR